MFLKNIRQYFFLYILMEIGGYASVGGWTKGIFYLAVSCMALSTAFSSRYFVFWLVYSRFYQTFHFLKKLFFHLACTISKAVKSFVLCNLHLRVFQEAVQVLLKHSADVNARDKNWQTPLHIAAANKAVKCAEALVPLLSNVNVSDRAGSTASCGFQWPWGGRCAPPSEILSAPPPPLLMNSPVSLLSIYVYLLQTLRFYFLIIYDLPFSHLEIYQIQPQPTLLTVKQCEKFFLSLKKRISRESAQFHCSPRKLVAEGVRV